MDVVKGQKQSKNDFLHCHLLSGIYKKKNLQCIGLSWRDSRGLGVWFATVSSSSTGCGFASPAKLGEWGGRLVMRSYIMISGLLAVRRFAGVDWPPLWDGELCLWPDETRPLSTYLWISRSRDSPSPSLPSLEPGRPLSALNFILFFEKQKVNIFNSSIHRLALVLQSVSPEVQPFYSTHPRIKKKKERRTDTERRASRCSGEEWVTVGPFFCFVLF